MESIKLHYDVSGNDFTCAGEASGKIKRELKGLGFPNDIVRNVAIAVYEGEINMVIHAGGGVAEVKVCEDHIEITLQDQGPGIKNIEEAMQEGFSTAPDQIRSLGFGAGMGLPNMKRYTDDMKISSTLGVGTTVVMRVNL